MLFGMTYNVVFWILFGIFIALQVADLISTKLSLSTGKTYEVNKLMAWIYSKLGFMWFILLKLVPIVFAFVLHFYIIEAAVWGLILLDILYPIGVINNFRLYFKYKG